MSDYDRDRGAYSPGGEAPLAFDARNAPGGGGGGGRPPTTLIISALILLVLVVALIFYYRSGVRRSGEPPLVGTPLSDIREAPPASAQPADESPRLQVYGAEDGAHGTAAASSAPPTFAPDPEQPLPRLPPPAATSPAPPAAAAAAAPAAPAQPPVPKPAPTPKPAPAPPVAASPPAAAAAGGGAAMVQIGALSSPALADKAWNDVARAMPGDMAGRTKRVEPVTTDAGATLYRAYIGGFSSRADAAAFCAKLKSAGKSCLVK